MSLNKLNKDDLNKKVAAPAEIKQQRDATPDENDNEWYFDVAESFTDAQITALFPDAALRHIKWSAKGKNEDAYLKVKKAVAKLHLHPLNGFTTIKNRKADVFTAADDYPIFLIDEEKFKIVYQPMSPDRAHLYLVYGDHPKSFLHGLAAAKNEMTRRSKKEAENKIILGEDENAEIQDEDLGKLTEMILVRDAACAVTLALMDYWPCFVTGKHAHFSNFDLMELNKLCKKVYQLRDNSDGAKKAAHEIALEHLEVFTIELPDQDNVKTLHDYFTRTNRFAFGEQMKDALPYLFWDKEPVYSGPKDKRVRVGWKYDFKSTQSYNFLNRMGFYRLPVEGRKMDYIYVLQDGNIIREKTPNKVKNFIHEFLRQRKMDVELRDTMYESTRLSEASLSNIEETIIDFTDNDEHTQWLFFENGTLEIKADRIKAHAAGSIQRFVWEKNVIKHNIEPAKSPFTITQQPDGSYDIKVNHQECLFFNYLIQTSRIHWRRELETELAAKSETEQLEYGENHKFEIDSELLLPEERYEQKQHLINKIFALGYFLHRHKVRSKTWAIVGTDDKISHDGKSHGGSGKSLCFNQAISHVFKDLHMIPGTNPNITQNPHIFHGLTKDKQGLIVDDADKYLNFRFFFEFITANQVVNNKNGDIFSIPFAQLCKMIWLTNFSFSTDPSTERRILYTVFSDYYHQKSDSNDYKETREPKDDFGKDLFTQFTQEEFNQFYNTIAYCIQFFLQCPVKINPPMSNVTKRKLQREMGAEFEAWASLYFHPQSNNLNRMLVKAEALQEFKRDLPKNYVISSTQFKRAIEAYCKFNGYVLNPEELINDTKDRRIVHLVPDRTLDRSGEWITATKKKALELIYIQTNFETDINKLMPGEEPFSPGN